MPVTSSTSTDWRSLAVPVTTTTTTKPKATTWDPATLRKSQALQDAVRAQSANDDEENTPLLDRAAKAAMGAVESIPGASLADEVRGAISTVPDAIKPLLATPAGPAIAATALAVDKLRGGGKYEQGRDAQREAADLAHEDPLSDLGRGLGTIAQVPLAFVGGAGKVAEQGIKAAAMQGAKAGALGGAIEGFGEGEGAGDSIKRAIVNAGLGAAVGAAGGAVGEAGSKVPALNYDVGNLAARGAANVISAAGKAAPIVGRGLGVVGGAAVGSKAGPVGVVFGGERGYAAGAKVGDAVGKAASNLAERIRPLPAEDALRALSLADDLGTAAGSPSGLELVRDVSGSPFTPATPSGRPIRFTAPEVDLLPDVPNRPTSIAKFSGRPIKFTAPVDDGADAQRAMTDMAESYDPEGKEWEAWLSGKGVEPTPRPELDQAAKVLSTGTKVDRTPAPKTPAPSAPSSTLSQVGRDIVATEHPEDFESVPMSANANPLLARLRQNQVNEAAANGALPAWAVDDGGDLRGDLTSKLVSEGFGPADAKRAAAKLQEAATPEKTREIGLMQSRDLLAEMNKTENPIAVGTPQARAEQLAMWRKTGIPPPWALDEHGDLLPGMRQALFIETMPHTQMRQRVASMSPDDVRAIVEAMPRSPLSNTPMSDAQINAEVKAAVKNGEPLKALADRLDLPQRDIAQKFQAARYGNL